MNKTYCIGGFAFALSCPDGVTPPENFALFESDAEPEYMYEMTVSGRCPEPRGRLITDRPDLTVFDDNGLEMRYIGLKLAMGTLACYMELDESHAAIYLSPAIAGSMNIDTLWLSLFAMERRLLSHGGMVLHCAYMRHKDEAILFSAPSETGKTTQATLWEKHRGSRVINGDRALLECIDGRWTARGWPVCGSSEVCHNEDTKIRAIVMLSQGKTDAVERLTPFQAFSQVYSQITINRWSRGAQKKAMDMIEHLVMHVPVYHLSCTISEDAVRCLESALYPEA